ncbi:MAG: hypothetical protein AVDCRST_MAG83-2427 [uncultured Arthrobacter sp.]|uniref:Uncharacterized protein n=1 Tax=uncultured Arthrobacter sp. TaxID=114050 RepID=A0A6J4IN62_9MICC|nr:hypothetical protein [uncultured Arthrobacter sp.]CAA9256348.1 MAG: hypothetical protein AVDCRST_MAG83-2427 [uncultured Arthrobacter sp.]
MPEEIQARSSNHAEAGDGARVTVRTESGEALTVGASELQSLAARLTTREQLVEQNKGPLLEMADEEKIPVPHNATKEEVVDLLVSRRAPLVEGEVLYEGTPQEIKGPGPEWTRDSGGNYVNR